MIPGDGTCDCIDPDFKPINCPTNTDPTLPNYDEYFGDSYCDGYLNTKENCFDGGDCCGKEVNTNFCTGEDCDCIDPDYKPDTLKGKMDEVCPTAHCTPFINDGACDADNNNKERCYDGGDCCKENVKCIPGKAMKSSPLLGPFGD